jgi:hypothetical protein
VEVAACGATASRDAESWAATLGLVGEHGDHRGGGWLWRWRQVGAPSGGEQGRYGRGARVGQICKLPRCLVLASQCGMLQVLTVCCWSSVAPRCWILVSFASICPARAVQHVEEEEGPQRIGWRRGVLSLEELEAGATAWCVAWLSAAVPCVAASSWLDLCGEGASENRTPGYRSRRRRPPGGVPCCTEPLDLVFCIERWPLSQPCVCSRWQRFGGESG